jgi:hypothetical protein
MSSSPSVSSYLLRTISTYSLQEENNEERIYGHKIQMEIVETNQKNFITTTRNRSANARATSRAFCCCTSIAYIIHYMFCFPTRLCGKKSWFDTSREYMGWGLERPPKNRRELCCRYCTPLCEPFPDITEPNGRDHFSLPEERDDEKQRITSLNLLETEITKLEKISQICRSSSCSEGLGAIHSRPPSPIKEEGQETNNYLAEYSIERLTPFSENITEES